MSRDNHQDIVQRIHDQFPPEHTVEGTVAFLARVLAALPREERAGMLRKDAGENIAPFHGVMVSAGRVCYPDGQLYKIATDIPNTLAPVWNDDGPVDPARYFDVTPFLGEAQPPAPAPGPNPPPEPAPVDQLDPLLDEFDQLFALGKEMIATLESVKEAINRAADKADALGKSGLRVHF